MKYPAIVLSGLCVAVLAAGPASGEDPVAKATRTCVDSNFGYSARPLSRHDVLVRNTTGKDKQETRLKTTCIGLWQGDIISVGSSFSCVGKGDTIVASDISGKRQVCKVTGVERYTPQEEDFRS